MKIVDWGFRKIAGRVLSAVLFILLSCPVFADELAHHWENPAYLGEMRFQVAAMMISVFAAAVFSWIVRCIQSRRREQ